MRTGSHLCVYVCFLLGPLTHAEAVVTDDGRDSLGQGDGPCLDRFPVGNLGTNGVDSCRNGNRVPTGREASTLPLQG